VERSSLIRTISPHKRLRQRLSLPINRAPDASRNADIPELIRLRRRWLFAGLPSALESYPAGPELRAYIEGGPPLDS
jgi:hypothetical protein